MEERRPRRVARRRRVPKVPMATRRDGTRPMPASSLRDATTTEHVR